MDSALTILRSKVIYSVLMQSFKGPSTVPCGTPEIYVCRLDRPILYILKHFIVIKFNQVFNSCFYVTCHTYDYQSSYSPVVMDNQNIP